MEFDSKVLSVYDGDTIHIAVPINEKLYKIKARILSIDTPEMKPVNNVPDRARIVKSAYRSRNRLIQLLTDVQIDVDAMHRESTIAKLLDKNKKIVKVRLGECDKYGRVLVEFPEIPVCETLIREGFAVRYDGGKKPSMPEP